jgi:AraC family transcriptional regulator
MADGASWPFGRPDPGVLPAGAERDRTVWTPTELGGEKSRSWQRTSAIVMTRAPGEAYWQSDQHRFTFALSDLDRVTVRTKGGRTHQLTVAPRVLGFTPAGVGVHSTITVPQWTHAQIVQSPETYRDLAAEFSSPLSFDDFEPLLAFDDPQMVLLLRSIIGEIESDALDHVLVDALNTALAVQLARHFRGTATPLLPPTRLSRERLSRVLDYIEAHLDGAPSLNDLAAVACLSPFHFSRCFKQSMGVAPHRYVMTRRIARARRFVLHSDMPLTEIAAAVGFDSQSSFTARFGREVGVSPGRLRRERA